MIDFSEFVVSFGDRIDQRAKEYAEWLDETVTAGGEPATFGEFEARVGRLLADYEPPRRLPDSVLFTGLYDAARPDTAESDWLVPGTVIAALIAAELESRGPARLRSKQQTELAAIYELCGNRFRAAGLPRHAALAFGRAVSLYRAAEDFPGQDRAGLALERARTEAATGRVRMLRLISDALCGYGYQPFRLLAWVGVELVIFTVIGLTMFRGVDWQTTLYLCTTSFLNPLGPSDTDTLGPVGRPVLAIESWSGTVSMSVYFALLVRLWFRM